MAHALPGLSGLTPKRLYEFINAGSRTAKDPCRKEGKLNVFWHLRRLSEKFLMTAMTQGGPLQIFSSFHGSSRRNLRTVTYLVVAWQGLRDMLANELILSWQNIIGAHKKKGEGIWWRLGREIKLPDLWMFHSHSCPWHCYWVLWIPNLSGLCRPRIGLGIFQWLTLTWVRNWTVIGVGEKYTAEGNRCY